MRDPALSCPDSLKMFSRLKIPHEVRLRLGSDVSDLKLTQILSLLGPDLLLYSHNVDDIVGAGDIPSSHIVPHDLVASAAGLLAFHVLVDVREGFSQSPTEKEI